jgi:hypothetical protein
MQHKWTEPLEENNLNQNVKPNFPASRWGVIGAQAKSAIEEKIKRQHYRHEQAIIQVSVKKRGIVVEVGFD